MLRIVAAALSALLLVPFSAAQAPPYPNKPIRFVLPFGPGSATDTISRIIANDMSQAIGQPIVLIHKPGADGSLAAVEVKRAAPDGYTFLVGTNSPWSVVPHIRKEPPYDTMTDFTPITFVGDTPFFIAVHPSVPAKNLKELVAHAKTNPGKLNYASGNTYGIVGTALFAHANGIQMQHIPYKSEPEAVPDFLSGQIQLMFGTPTTIVPHAKAGKLVAIAAILDERSSLLPDVPTVAEQGFPPFEIKPWFAFAGPAGLPPEIVEFMNKAFATTLSKPEIKQQLAQFGLTPKPSTASELAKFFREQLVVWKAALAKAGIEPQ